MAEHADAVGIIKKANERATVAMRETEDELDRRFRGMMDNGEVKDKPCIPVLSAQNHVIKAHRQASEQTLENQEYMMDHLVRATNGHSKRVKIGPVELNGYKLMDIVRVLGLAALVYLVLKEHGVDLLAMVK